MDLRSSLLSWKISSPWSSRLSENRPGTSPSKLSAPFQISLSNRLWKALLPSVTETLPPLSLCLSNGKPLQNQSHPQNISNGLPKSKNLPMPDDTTCPFFCAAGCPPIIEDTLPDSRMFFTFQVSSSDWSINSTIVIPLVANPRVTRG